MENYSYNSSYPESGDSSPRSREVEFENPTQYEELRNNLTHQVSRVKFMCSYGGKIQPRPHDNQLSYVGGETKILAVDRNVKFSFMMSKLVATCESDNISFKYQLPGEDLDALISVTNDDDLEHMMHEYDRLCRVSPKPARLRIFIFPSRNSSVGASARSFGSEEGKSEKERFVEALNSAPSKTSAPAVATPILPSPAGNVDFLFGLEKANVIATANPHQQPMIGRVQVEDSVVVNNIDERLIRPDPIQKHIHDLQRLRIEEQQGIYRKKSDENLAGGFSGGDYHKVPEKISQIAIPGGYPYLSEKQVSDGYFPASNVNNENQPVYMIPAPASAYHAPMMRPVTGAPNQGYYTVQRVPSDNYRDHQQMYNVNPANLPPQKVTTGGVGVVMDTGGYPQVAYDRGVGRQVIYSAPAPGQAAQYQAVGSGSALNLELGGKVVAKTTQASL